MNIIYKLSECFPISKNNNYPPKKGRKIIFIGRMKILAWIWGLVLNLFLKKESPLVITNGKNLPGGGRRQTNEVIIFTKIFSQKLKEKKL